MYVVKSLVMPTGHVEGRSVERALGGRAAFLGHVLKEDWGDVDHRVLGAGRNLRESPRRGPAGRGSRPHHRRRRGWSRTRHRGPRWRRRDSWLHELGWSQHQRSERPGLATVQKASTMTKSIPDVHTPSTGRPLARKSSISLLPWSSSSRCGPPGRCRCWGSLGARPSQPTSRSSSAGAPAATHVVDVALAAELLNSQSAPSRAYSSGRW